MRHRKKISHILLVLVIKSESNLKEIKKILFIHTVATKIGKAVHYLIYLISVALARSPSARSALFGNFRLSIGQIKTASDANKRNDSPRYTAALFPSSLTFSTLKIFIYHRVSPRFISNEIPYKLQVARGSFSTRYESDRR